MTFSKKLLASSVLVALSSSAFAGLEGNYGATSDYIWRGQTQGSHGSAVFGGVDWSNDAGAHAGIWQSGGVTGTNETDLYGGYGLKAGSVDLDVGFIAYKYFSSPTSDFNEIYLTADFGAAAAGVYIDSANKNTYINLSTEVAGFGLEFGSNTNDSSASNYTHVGVSYGLTDDVSMGFYTVSGNAAATNPTGFTLTFSKGFDM